MARTKTTLYRGSLVHSIGLDRLDLVESATVGVDQDGTIIFSYREPVTVEQVAEDHKLDLNDVLVLSTSSKESFFFPGFVDTHIHAPQFPNTGIFGESTLLDWLTTYTFPLEASFADLKRAEEVYSAVIARTLANGTTTASYYATVHVEATKKLADLALQKNQRAFIGRVCMDSNSPEFYCDHSTEAATDADIAVIEHIDSIDPAYDIVSPIVTPRFAASCTAESLKAMGQTVKERNLPCQTHISENKDEIAWVKRLFPEASSYADVYDKAGLLTKKTILAHAVHLTEEEIDLVKTRNSGVAHCPISNSAIGSGLAPVRDLLRKDIKVGLGTDVSGGYSPSILETARQALTVSRLVAFTSKNDGDKLSAAEVLYLATMGGAKVCNLDRKIGNFEVGKKWDAQLIDLSVKGSPVDVFSWFGGPEPVRRLKLLVEKWLFNGDDRNTRKVWVNGRLVMEKE